MVHEIGSKGPDACRKIVPRHRLFALCVCVGAPLLKGIVSSVVAVLFLCEKMTTSAGITCVVFTSSFPSFFPPPPSGAGKARKRWRNWRCSACCCQQIQLRLSNRRPEETSMERKARSPPAVDECELHGGCDHEQRQPPAMAEALHSMTNLSESNPHITCINTIAKTWPHLASWQRQEQRMPCTRGASNNTGSLLR